jgi:predicted ATPase/DNA-binding XRE family transcriptional regulator
MNLDTSFGRWLRQRRRALDLTQDGLARQIGCAVVTIQKLEADERRPSRLLAERLADGLMVAAEERGALIMLARGEPYCAPTPAQAVEPPPRAPEQPPTNLPTPLTRLIGRKQDIAAARNTLLRGKVRLLTLIGSPGIGKTRLSIEVAREVQAAFSDGVSFVALAPISDPSLVIATIAQTLRVRESAGESLLEMVKAALHSKRLLLLLDNFEHLLDATPLVLELLEACPGLKALVTSRAPLRVPGEQLYTVPPLLVPTLAQLPTTGALARTPAVALFVERAQAVLPEFRLTEQNAPIVAAICVRLDGLPLAIELAAVWVRALACAEIAQEIDNNLGFLATSLSDVPTRQRSLHAVFDHSWRLLTEHEQRVLRRLSVFRGGLEYDAAEAVADATLLLLAALVDKSLLRRNETGRYELHELIRQYAEEQLHEFGETERVYDRHLEYCLALAEAGHPTLWGAQRDV